MSQSFSVSSIISALLRRFWLVFAITFVGSVAAVYIAMQRPTIYEAIAVIQFEMAEVEENPTSPGARQTGTTVETRLQLIEQKLMSRDSLIEVIEKFDLFAGDPSMTDVQKVGLMRQAAQIDTLVDPAQAWRPDVQPSGLIITVRLAEAQAAADVANELLSRVLIEGKSRRSVRAEKTLAFFVAEEERVTREIAALERELADYKTEHQAALPENLTSLRNQLASLSESLLAVERQLIQLQTQSDRIRAEDLERQTNLLRQQKVLLDERSAIVQAALASAPEVERQLNALQRSLGQLQDELRVITTRRADAAMNRQLESQNQGERFEVLETAVVPQYPVSSGRRKVAAAGAIGSLVLAIGLALGLEFMNAGIRTAHQMEKELDIRPVVVIPNLDRQKHIRRRRLAWIVGLMAFFAGFSMLLRARAQDLMELLSIFRRSKRGSI